MDFEPQKFFVGLIDFFSILLPGALLTFLLKGEIQQTTWVAQRLPELNGAKGWAAFVVVSYVLGHLAFLLGSWLDEFYDVLRRRTQNAQIKQLVRRHKSFFWWTRILVWLVFKRETDAVHRAGKIKELYLSPLHAKKAINNFQWCKALLTVESPDSLATVQRFEADSKFFRCFVIVLLVLVGLALSKHHWTWAIASAVLLPLTLWRYMDQRYKATNHAYWAVITLAARAGKIVEFKKESSVSDLTHAGGVVFRKPWYRREARYLLVESNDVCIEWVLPKGKIEANEELRETAVREVHEESGVWARIVCDLGRLSYSANGNDVRAHIFLMKQAGCGFRTEYTRKIKWLKLEEAKRKATHLRTRELLELAEKHRLRT